MSFQIRKAKILALLEEKGAVAIHELSTQLGLSGMTIRRDLNTLTQMGLITRTHGGAMLPDSGIRPVSFRGKSISHSAQKEWIAQRAAQEIGEGDCLFMDCGSTVFALCPFIRHKAVTVITNSLPVVAELIHSTVRVNLIGGEVDKERQAVHGLTAESHIARYRADKAFIGSDGVSLANGLSAHSEQEAALTLALMRQAGQVYLLCDSSKLEQNCFLQFAPLKAIDVLVTDQNADPTHVDAYRQAGIRVLL